MQNIDFVVQKNMCSGCGTCISICPKNAIDLQLNSKKGLFQPIINKELCNNCGLCYKICPGIEMDFDFFNNMIFGHIPKETITGNYIGLYGGNTKNQELNRMCSSGGIITEILIYSLENGLIDGALVTRMNKNNPLEPEPFIARTKEEIISASKSKYCPVPVNVLLNKILDSPINQKFAVVGLPCHIQGIRKAQLYNTKLNDKIYLCIGLFCRNTDTFLATEYILKWSNINKNDVSKLCYRGNGWPGSMQIDLKDGTTKIIPFDKYITVHELCIFTPERCGTCIDGVGELSDISVGDAWGIVNVDNLGKSVCITRTEKGESLLKRCLNENSIELTSISEDKLLNSQGLVSANRFKNARAKIVLNKLQRKILPIYKKSNLNLACYSPSYKNYVQHILLGLHKNVFRSNLTWKFTYKLIEIEIPIMKKLKLKK